MTSINILLIILVVLVLLMIIVYYLQGDNTVEISPVEIPVVVSKPLPPPVSVELHMDPSNISMVETVTARTVKDVEKKIDEIR